MKEIKAKYPLVDSINEGTNELPIVVQEEVKGLIHFFAKMLIQASHKLTGSEAKARAIQLMKEVGIPDPERRFYQYPFEFSGGMRQRIVIAIALSGNPEILICDEPTTALDVTIQAQILELIQRLKAEKNLSIIFITHDLGVVANMADDIAVMYAGKIVEYGSVYDVFYDPRHPYTWALLSSMPDLDTKGRLDAIPGTPPNMLLPPRGDAFAARNSYAVALDYKQEPPFFKVSETHSVKTWLAHKDSIDVVPPKTVIERIRNSLAKNPSNTPSYDLKKNSVLEILKVKGGNK
ncbi:MAG: ABC transporter ATP-binding protein [Bacilli bacterium]|nr:ABC transporter ATP-binding protein [Bacilli bacterium]